MDPVEKLLAIEEIRSLIARYAISFDDYDWETFGSLWTDDAVFAANGISFEGKGTLLEFLTTCLPPDYTGKHMNSPALIEVAPDGQSATAKTDVVWISQDFENRIVARYDDTLVKVDGQWLFSSRIETTVEFKPGDPPMSEAAIAVSSATMRK